MNEKELLEKIKQSAEEIEIPDGLCPEEIKKRITVKKKSRGRLHGAIAAAAIFAVCVMLCIPMLRKDRDEAAGPAKTAESEADAADQAKAADENRNAGQAEEGTAEEISEDIGKPKQDAGDLFVVAGDYGEVYDVLKKQEIMVSSCFDYDMGDNGGTWEGEAGTGGIGTEDTAARFENKLVAAESAAVKELAATEYSRTNLQTAGVDESDFVKTDGKLIYVVKDNSVVMADVSGKQPVKRGEIALPNESSSDDVLEMYVDDGILNVIVQREKTDLKKDTGEDAGSSVEDVYRFETNMETEILTYDIGNPANPVLKGSVRQDGYYKSSRKIGSMIYLFTAKRAELPVITREKAVMEENAGGWIPLVNGKAVAADCIYLSETGTEGLLISSVNIKRPEDTVDQTFILNDYAEIYVSTEALYLYYSDYHTNDVQTNIAKFSLNRGRIDAVGAASVSGTVMDTFAVNESSDAKLRILTTSGGWGTGEGNNLYILDENLKLKGKLTGIAPGEQIYAARYFGDTAYFVTYRNTDPLFAVDLSDDGNPKLLGELKITGFSEYLHFWGDDKLVGIGYETDPDTGEQKGMKVTMFDISDPASLKEIKSIILKDADYSDALYDYKSVLVDFPQNLIGFPAESYGKGSEYRYLLFSWDGTAFRELLADTLEDEAAGGTRGMYIGDKFVIVTTGNIKVYDRKRGYQFTANLLL